jgi:hypothetical protein
VSLDTITTPDGEERRLGCLVPAAFPTGFPTFADSFPSEMLAPDAIRSALAGKPSMWGRRQRFAGKKYIRNQRSFGSCNGWSTAGTLSRVRELRGEPYVCLSGADAYSQMNGGRDNGSVLADGMKIVEVGGIAPEDLVPWDHVFAYQIPPEARAARTRFRGFKVYACDEEIELASALVLGRCGVVAVHATNSFNRQDGDGVNLGGNGVGNHSVGVQDIRLAADGTLQFDMPNSWDTEWCDGGYTWLTWNRHLRETVKYHRFWVLVSTADDPGDGSTPPAVGA